MKNIWEKEAYYQDIEDVHNIEISESDIMFSKVIKLLSNYKNSKILDFGCGEGWLINEIGKRIDNSNHFFGVDVSSVGIQKCISKKIDNSQFIKYDGNKIPFQDNYFDVVLSSFVFEHLSNPELAFNEIGRVVKSGGCIIIMCPNFGSPFFKSPCNNNSRIKKMILNLFQEFISASKFKNGFKWKKVEPIELPEDVHISDYDTLCEPSLSNFEKYLSNFKSKYSIIEISSILELFDKSPFWKNVSFLKKVVIFIIKLLGKRKIFRFQYFGSLFFVVLKKI